MFEVWWNEGDTHALQAKFASLGDALRFIWRYEHERDARVRLPDGTWKHVEQLEVPMEKVLPRVVERAARRSPAAMALRKRIVEEITRRLGAQHSRLVERVVGMTLDIIVQLHTAEGAPSDRPAPRGRSRED